MSRVMWDMAVTYMMTRLDMDNAMCYSDGGGRGYIEWVVHPHDKPPDGGGSTPAMSPEGTGGGGPLCACRDVPLDEGGVPGVQGDVGHGHDLHDEAPVTGGRVIVPIQLDEIAQVGPRLPKSVLSHGTFSEIKTL